MCPIKVKFKLDEKIDRQSEGQTKGQTVRMADRTDWLIER